mgnify:CR=1 FL=1
MNIREDACLVSHRGSRVLKTFDRLFGIPAIGDTLLLTGALRDVAAAFPSARLSTVPGLNHVAGVLEIIARPA